MTEMVTWQTDASVLDMYTMLMQTPDQSNENHFITMLQLFISSY